MIKIKLKRNGKKWYNKNSSNGEEILSVYINGSTKPMLRGMCKLFFERATGNKLSQMKIGESKTFTFIDINTLNK